MKSELAKVLHAICGRSLLGHVLAAAEPLGADRHRRRRRPPPRPGPRAPRRDRVDRRRRSSRTSSAAPVTRCGSRWSRWRIVDRRHGRRAARRCTAAHRRDAAAPGAPPRTRPTRLRPCSRRDAARRHRLWPGRPRARDGHVVAIVEERDADDRDPADQRGQHQRLRLRRRHAPRARSTRITTDNAQGEEYLTDVIGLLVADGAVVASVTAADHLETLGRQRPRPARRGTTGDAGPDRRALDARGRHDHRSADHLDGRAGHARARRHDPPEHPAPRRHPHRADGDGRPGLHAAQHQGRRRRDGASSRTAPAR